MVDSVDFHRFDVSVWKPWGTQRIYNLKPYRIYIVTNYIRYVPVLFAVVLAPGMAAGQAVDLWPEYEEVFARAFAGYDSAREVTVQMVGPREVEPSVYGQWSVVFEAGTEGLSTGAAVAVAFRHVSGWGTAQSFDPGAVNFTTVSTTGKIRLSLQTPDNFAIFNRHFYEYFPWQHITWAVITEGELQPGERITLVFGDRSQGSPGFRPPSVARPQALLLSLFKRASEAQLQPIPARLSVATLPSRAVSLSVIIPSSIGEGESFPMIVRAEDNQGNLATGYQGRVSLESAAVSHLPETYTFQSADSGIHTFSNLQSSGAGPFRVRVRDLNAGFETHSNPGRVAGTGLSSRVLWGDFHAHSVVSDGTDSVDQLYRYARDVAGLDFFAVSDHAYQMPGAAWERNEKITTQFHDPPRFSTFYGNEWSGMTDVGGDHNVIYSQPGLPIYRSNSYYEPKNPFLYSGSDLDAPHIIQLYKRLERLAAERGVRALAFPSIRGRRANPQWNDLRFSPILEVISEAGWFEELALDFLRRGHRVGFVGSSDDPYGRPGYGIGDRPDVGYRDPGSVPARLRNRMSYPWGQAVLGSPLMAVMATGNDREAIFDAIFARRCYATTGARILLEFSADGHDMGEEFVGTGAPLFEVIVRGEQALRTVHLKKDGRTLHTWTPESDTLDTSLSYREEADARGHFYYVIVNQVDGHRAISSPIWVD